MESTQSPRPHARSARRMADRMRAVAAAAAGIVRTRSLEHLQEVLREAAARVVDFDAFTLALLDAEARALVFVPGEDAGIAVPGNTVPLAGRPSEVVLRERRSVVTRRAGEAAAQGADLVGTGRRSESAIRSPIVAGDEVLGVLSVQSYTPGRYGPEDVEVLETLASLAAVAVTDQRLRAQRDRSVEALLQREARFRAMIEGAEDMVLLVTAAGTLGYCSPSVTRVLGYGPDQLRGRDAFSLVHPSHRDAVHAAFGRRTDVVGVGEPMRFLVRHAGGGWRRLEARASNLLGSPAVAGVVVNARDVTREAVIEEALRESEWHFRQLVQTSPDGLLVETGDRIRFANPAAIHMLGADSLDELAERSLLDLVDPDGRAAMGAAMRAAREDRAARPRLEQRFLRRDGQELFGEVILSGIPWAGEAAVQVILRDTTERRRAAAALTLQQAYLEQLFESAPEGIVLLDLQDRVVRANAEFGRIFGYAPAEVVGRRINDLIAPDAAEASAISARAALGETVRAETVRRHRDGSPLHVSVLGAPVSVAGGPVAIYGIYRDISAQKALEEQLIRHAFHDPLTDLPNRALLLDRLERAALRSRGQGSFAVLFLDLDNLKYVNDSLGHAAGDRLLLMVARRLVQVVREGDTVARLSGDEFVLLLEELESPEVAVGVAQRVAEQLEAPFSIGDAQMGATASIGIAFGPAPGAGPEQVLRNADAAMYRAKSSGRGQHAVFDPAADRGALSRGGMRAELRRAIDAGELVLHYQPIAGLAGGGAAGCEALVRWQHPQRGLLGPADFVPLAEECGLIAPIGYVVLREAIRQLAAWQARPGAAPGTFVSVNVSVQQLSPSLPPRIREWLEEAGVAPECLWVEVTESGVVGPTDEALGVLHAVRALGVRIAIDDFGTGYSALSYLAHLPADVLKVDRSFVSDLREDGGRANQLVEGIVRLAHSLGMEVVAEGIETPHQLAQLTAMGCDRGQGFHLGRPAPPADAAPWTVLAG